MQKHIFLLAVLFAFSMNAQQKTYCNPINIDYGYTPFEVFSKQGKHRATADPVIVNFQKNFFFSPQTNRGIGIATICSIGNS